MKKTKIVIPALAVLLLSTAASVSGTVAWFSMSTSVTVTGMSVTTKVSSNLQIAETNAEENYGDSITQSREGVIEPASSINGVGFYWTTNGLNDGDASSEAYTSYNESSDLSNVPAGKAKYDSAFNTAYQFSGALNDVSYAYIDYSFYLKGSASIADQQIAMTKCNLLYNTQPVTQGFAWRVGMFVANSAADTDTSDATAVDANNLVTILDFASSKNQNQRNRQTKPVADTPLPGDPVQYYTDANCSTPAASGTADGQTSYYVKGDDDPKAVNSTSTLDDVVSFDEPATVHEFTALNQVKYFKVVIRLWLEGEDTTCTSTTFAQLTQAWTLDLEFKLADGLGANAPVENIGSVNA